MGGHGLAVNTEQKPKSIRTIRPFRAPRQMFGLSRCRNLVKQEDREESSKRHHQYIKATSHEKGSGIRRTLPLAQHPSAG
jgi:hypothetical protein